jgi:hypothetical protein
MDPAQIMEVTLVLSLYSQAFHCLRCKCPMFVHHMGMIEKITPGLVLAIPGVGVCPNPKCGMQYFFKGFIKNITGATKTVTLSMHHLDADPITAFHCPECRAWVFQYPGQLLDIMPGKTTGHPMFAIRCPDSRCAIRYLVYEF